MAAILLIEDDQLLRKALRICLDKAGYSVLEAADGRRGLALHESQHIDLVVTDLIMPDVEGLETIRTIRQRDPLLPIVAISGGGRSNQDYLRIASKIGANLVLPKPLEFAHLCAGIANLLAPIPS